MGYFYRQITFTHFFEPGAVTNFFDRLPFPHSKLAHDILKSPYNFGFLTLSDDYIEKELEQGLVNNMEELILELGQGFAFIGRQYHLEIAGDDYYLDMLFYHIKLRAFCIVELLCCIQHKSSYVA